MAGRRRDGRSRRLVALEAARLMYREGVSEYLTAKRIAARRVLGKGSRGARFRPGVLPSNGEIRDALRDLAIQSEGAVRDRRLLAMRIVALEWMRALQPWHPRLIGSVWSGHARRGSDIDLHVFADSVEEVELGLSEMGQRAQRKEVVIRFGSTLRTFTHLYLLDGVFPVELSVYLPCERRITTRSSTDGKAIDRVSARRLEELLKAEHTLGFERWRATGDLDLAGLEEGPMPGVFDGLLDSLA